MASELIVQTLKGPTSGANANKVIIPSGQTLDMSAGTLTPSSGQIINQEFHILSGTTNNTTSTFADFASVSYTPVLTSSKIYFVWSVYLRTSQDNAAEARANIRTLVDGVQYAFAQEVSGYDYGNSGIWLQSHYQLLSYKDNTTGSSTTHKIQGRTISNTDEIGINANGASNQSFLQITEVAK
jgi:hypothetical protein